MSEWLKVESDAREVLLVLRPDNMPTGKHILNFLDGVLAYCTEGDADTLKWFSKLEATSQKALCQLEQTLTSSFCVKEFDYREDEYDLYLRRYPAMSLTEDEFKKVIQQAEEAFRDIASLLTAVNEFLRLLTETELEPTWWYVPEGTENDLRALAETLSFFAKRGAREARIIIR